MDWQQFSALALTILYYLLLWSLVAIPATLVLFAIAKFFPTSPGEAAARVWNLAPLPTSATAKFFDALSKAREALSLGTVRILLDRKHAELKRELEKIRKILDRQLAKLTKTAGAKSGNSLIDLIRSFQKEREEALEIHLLQDDYPNHAVPQSKARAAFGFSLFFLLLFIFINFGLLYLFFDEFFSGQTIPFLGVQLAPVIALMFPLVEAASGVGSELILEKDDNPGTKALVGSALILAIFALATLEFFIFYQLFAGGFSLISDFERGGALHYGIACVGPALTALEASFGFSLARNFLRLREFSASVSLKEQVDRQLKFVNGLEDRYDAIDEASARAGESLDDLAAQIEGRGEATVSIAADLEEQRAKFLEAMDSVNPRKWKAYTEPSAGDVSAITAFAWFIPIGLLLVGGIFTFVFQDSLRESGLVVSEGLAIAVALVVPLAALISGGWVFERTSSAVDLDNEWKDVLSPRDNMFRIAGMLVLSLLTIATLWICTKADGATGFAEGLLLVAFLLCIAWVGSYVDLALRGLAFLVAVIANAFIWLLRQVLHLGHRALLLAGAGISALILLFLNIVAYPVTFTRSLFRTSGRRQEPELVK